MEWYESLKETIKRELEPKGISQREFARSIEIDEVNFNKYLNGTKTPRIDTLIKIAKGLDCSLDYLLGLSKAKYVEPTEDDKAILKVSELTGLNVETLEWFKVAYEDSNNYLNNHSLKFEIDKYTGLADYFSIINKAQEDNTNDVNSFVKAIYHVDYLSMIAILNYYASVGDNFLFNSLYRYLQVGNGLKINSDTVYKLMGFAKNEDNNKMEVTESYDIDPQMMKEYSLQSVKDSLADFIEDIHAYNENNNGGK